MATVKKARSPEKISITMTELILQNVDRSRADLRKWWYALQCAEQISYPNRSQLYDLYMRSITDGHLSGVMEKRVTAILNKNLHYEIDGKRVEEMEPWINSEGARLTIRKMWEAKAWGLTGFEFLPGPEYNFVDIPRKHIKPEKKIISFEQNGFEGIDYSNEWNILVYEDVERFGLLLKSVPYTILKTGSLSDLAQYIELYGQPIRKGTYPGDDPEAKAELKKALKEAGASMSVIVPEGTNIEIIGDHVTPGTGAVHDVLFRRCNNEISILWLGNTETTSNDNGGSDAKTKEQSKQQQEIHKSDLLDIENKLSREDFQLILKSYGLPVDPKKGKFKYEKDFDLEQLSKRKDIDLVVSKQVPVSDDYWYETYGVPKPDNYDELKAKMEAERQQFNSNDNPDDIDPDNAPKKKAKPKPKPDEKAKLSAWVKFRAAMADFFDPAPEN